jgi:hypothetical protein
MLWVFEWEEWLAWDCSLQQRLIQKEELPVSAYEFLSVGMYLILRFIHVDKVTN